MGRNRINTRLLSVSATGNVVIIDSNLKFPDTNAKVKHERRQLHPSYNELSEKLQSKLNKYKKLEDNNIKLARQVKLMDKKALGTIDKWFSNAIKNSE